MSVDGWITGLFGWHQDHGLPEGKGHGKNIIRKNTKKKKLENVVKLVGGGSFILKHPIFRHFP